MQLFPSLPETGTTFLAGAAWFLISSILTTHSTTSFLKYRPTTKLPPPVNKQHNRQLFSLPHLLTLYRFGGSFFLSILSPSILSILSKLPSTIPSFLLPALFMTLANLGNVVALDRIGISLTYTTKCAIPIMTILLQVCLKGNSRLPPTKSLIAVLPIALGIGMASWNSPRFEKVGFGCALGSAAAQSGLNVYCKKAIETTSVKGFDVQRNLVVCAFAFLTLKQAVLDRITNFIFKNVDDRKGISLEYFLRVLFNCRTPSNRHPHPPGWLSVYTVCSYHLEYSLSFIFLSRIDSVSFSVCDAIRRLAIIIVGRKLFGGAELTVLNKVGIASTISGAVLYAFVS